MCLIIYSSFEDKWKWKQFKAPAESQTCRVLSVLHLKDHRFPYILKYKSCCLIWSSRKQHLLWPGFLLHTTSCLFHNKSPAFNVTTADDKMTRRDLNKSSRTVSFLSKLYWRTRQFVFLDCRIFPSGVVSSRTKIKNEAKMFQTDKLTSAVNHDVPPPSINVLSKLRWCKQTSCFGKKKN